MRLSKAILADPPHPRKSEAVNVLPCDEKTRVLHMLVEGASLRSVTRLTGIHRTTTMKHLLRAGDGCRELLDRRMRDLRLDHVQCDEIWTFCRKKQANIRPEEVGDDTIGDQFLFVALDEETKLVPVYVLGKRNRENTEAFMLDLSARMLAPALGSFGDRPQISTDGWAAYPGAVDLAFADTVDFGVIIKDYTESPQPGRYGPPEMTHADRRPHTKGLDPMTICTSHVERHNLTIRTFLRRFTRLALGFSKKLANLEAAIALYVAHYNFCRRHETLRRTPAMAAGIAGHRWSMRELLTEAGVL